MLEGMQVAISMLRGINVGGHNVIGMEALRGIYRALGLANPRTHIQSGNVIFGTNGKDLPALAAKIEKAIEAAVQFRPAVILRSVPEMKDVVAQNPFADRNEVAPNKLNVYFLASDPGPAAAGDIRKLQGGPEELYLIGRELYVNFPNGISGSKLKLAWIDKALKVPATVRNWNTVNKLVELGEAWTPGGNR
jgi:uncharacterized protein (DUF1697 family)